MKYSLVYSHGQAERQIMSIFYIISALYYILSLINCVYLFNVCVCSYFNNQLQNIQLNKCAEVRSVYNRYLFLFLLTTCQSMKLPIILLLLKTKSTIFPVNCSYIFIFAIQIFSTIFLSTSITILILQSNV